MLLSENIVGTFLIVLVNVDWSYSRRTYKQTTNETYLATAHCEILLDIHESIMHALEMLVEDEEKRLAFIKRHLNRFKEEHQMAMTDADYMRNPLNAFIVIKRLTKDLDQIKELIQTLINNAKDFLDVIKVREHSLPSKVDLVGAVFAVRRIRGTYEIDVEKLSKGVIDYGGVVFYSSPMSGDDCFEMSQILFADDDYHGAKTWLERAMCLDKLEESEENDSYYESYLDNIHDELNKHQNIYIQGTEQLIDWKTLNALCRNELQVPYNVSKRFTCYLSRSNPFLQLAPVKTEQLYTDPDVYMFYDVISDDEIEHLKRLSGPKLRQAARYTKQDLEYLPDYRTCKVAWIGDEDSEVAARISQRVADFTGWYMKSAEGLQIVNYGIGGHYDEHYDAFRVGIDPEDERLATVLFYMSDVTQGGATVFLKLGLSVFPVKNTALVWTNLHPSGQAHWATLHAACPVLIGTKWIATKWIHQEGQEFIRPCNLEYQNEEEVPVAKPILRPV